ncbi:MAG: hypothetical protein FWD68_02990 [Alphaproteobacteria bacterium]|nr:hypothetical protein [Alphaproteobacteria bacterium]
MMKPRSTPTLLATGCVALAIGGAGAVLAQQAASTARVAPAQLQAGKPALSAVAAKRPAAAVPTVQPQTGQAVAAGRQAVASSSESVFDQQIREGRIDTCAKVFGVLGRGLTDGYSYAVRSQWNAQAVNGHAIQSLVALRHPSVQQTGAGIVFTAPVGRSCEGSVVRVTPIQKNCVEVAADLAKSNGRNIPLGDLPLVAMPNGSQIMLLPSDRICISVTVLRAATAG